MWLHTSVYMPAIVWQLCLVLHGVHPSHLGATCGLGSWPGLCAPPADATLQCIHPARFVMLGMSCVCMPASQPQQPAEPIFQA
jgi:hypothetical protein